MFGVAGLGVIAAAIHYGLDECLHWLEADSVGRFFHPFAWIPLVIPAICFLIGVVELVSGKPWRRTDAAVQSLTQGRQIALFIVIVGAATALAFLIGKLVV